MHGGSVDLPKAGGGKRKRRPRANEDVALQITSMADVFTILLVFLIKSFSVSSVSVSIGKDTQLPVANGGQEQVEALRVEIHSGAVLLEGEPVIGLNQFVPTEAGSISSDGTIPELVNQMQKQRKRQQILAAAGNEVSAKAEKDSKLLVMADKRVPYRLLKQVLASASVQDFTDFKLVVVQQE